MTDNDAPRDATQSKPGGFRQFIKRDDVRLCLLFVVVLLPRLPFLSAGYGAHVDAWRIANTAQHIAQTHDYVVSRFPGYPVQEIACAFLWKGGPVALNGASALFSAITVLLLALTARQMGSKDYLLMALALAFAPVFYINSVTSKDYIWALAFTLGSLYSILKGRPVVAGICLGFAIGSRITSGVAALPFCLILNGLSRDNRPVKKTVIFALASTVTAIIVFLPVYLKYGPGFFHTYDQQYPDWRSIIYRCTGEIWGTFGLFGLLIALGGIFMRTLSKPRKPPMFTCAPFHAFAWICAVVIYMIMFLRMPHHSAYLIPMMPFVLLLLARFTMRPAFAAFCLLVMAGSFVTFDTNGFSSGAIFKDHEERLTTTASIHGFLSFTQRLPGKNVFVVGAWEPEITNLSPTQDHPYKSYVYLLTGEEAVRWHQSGATLYYVSDLIRQFNYRVNGIDLARYGAKDVRALYESEMSARPAPTPK